jgi:hypothetical protein
MTTNRQDMDVWKPVESSGTVIEELNRVSAIEAVARPEAMASDTKRVRRSGDFDVAGVAKGAEYGFDMNNNDYIELIAAKVGGLRKFAEEDLGGDVEGGEALLANAEKQAMNALAVTYDQGCIGTTAARNGTTVLWPSIYYTLATNDGGAAGDPPLGAYTGGANIKQWDQSTMGGTNGSVGYEFISSFLALYEEGPYFDEGNTVVLASPAWKHVLRTALDGNKRPYWQDGQDNLFGYSDFRWTVGARKHATTTNKPTGSPLLVIANRDLLIKGMAKLTPSMVNGNPGVAIQRAANGVGFTSDEAIFKAAMRRAFVLGEPRGAAILEYNTDLTP